MKKIVWINSERLKNAHRKERVDGIDLTVELSPYSTPDQVSGDYDEKTGVFTIVFKYADQEPPGRPIEFDRVKVSEGKFTGKIMTIAVPMNTALNDKTCFIQLQTKVLKALDNRRERIGKRVDSQLNESVAREVIQHDLGELIGR